jgi:hypothetical protein
MTFHALAENDVIRLEHSVHALPGCSQCSKVSEFLDQLREYLKLTDEDSDQYAWIGAGIRANVLSAHQNSVAGWQEGYIRLWAAFSPDQNSEFPTQSSQILLQETDVFNTDPGAALVGLPSCMMVADLYYRCRALLHSNDISMARYYWFSRGIECSVLSRSGNTTAWQEGLVRIQLAFSPKQPLVALPQNSLDDVISGQSPAGSTSLATHSELLDSLREPIQ